ncbi:4-hydroxy-tetrahydrodipicolinate reductase [Parasphaerochaeta coccoides]|uniref:4-hydroxy-tetrahydrodipicolinate reductase n=1 Tax=Parasphaerochaeta coccoides (strain ATCC BAA-1237 / DSM 17374 / SPN1) TaxID=760011 RepID=F4GHA6_PARC1|nr:4-hydroxy-tetrahydrodipicolinate reductase [Parasphaerochaeta coccoides]AEC02005.1 Dihydrodipicolinate reductase [Parasphaerochaeta coccoides DSM 17374]
MRIGIVGYGRMGHLIESLARQKGWKVVAIIDPVMDSPSVTARTLSASAMKECDVVVDFSSPESAVDNILFYAREDIPAVIGTTGWHERLDEVRAQVDENRAAIIYSGNFSIGVHLFVSIVRHAARLIDGFDDYDALVSELHHAGKADSPSGTALMIATAIMDNVKRKKHVETGRLDRMRAADELHVVSGRVGSVPGTHTVIFDSPADTLELTHRARSREGFAYGALAAAQWIADGRKGFFTLDDMMGA